MITQKIWDNPHNDIRVKNKYTYKGIFFVKVTEENEQKIMGRSRTKRNRPKNHLFKKPLYGYTV